MPAAERRIRRGFRADRPFFAAAAVYAALAVPLWALQYLGRVDFWQDSPLAWHGHEMIFGYALAVVGGFLITKGSATAILTAFGLWLAGRALHLGAAPGMVAAAVDLAYLGFVFRLGGLPFLRAAKSWRNAVFGLAVGALLAAEGVYWLGLTGPLDDGGRRGLVLAVDLITLLLFTMGGRLIAAATSGAFQQKGDYLPGVAQAGLEKIGVLALAATVLVDLATGEGILGALPVAVAGGVVFLRLVRWRIWRVVEVIDVSVLYLGYAWLGLGLLVAALGRATDLIGFTDSLHGILVGALGTLSLVVMARTVLQRSRRPLVLPLPVRLAVGLMTLAAVLRILALPVGPPEALLLGAAGAWGAAYLAFLVFLLGAWRGADRPADQNR